LAVSLQLASATHSTQKPTLMSQNGSLTGQSPTAGQGGAQIPRIKLQLSALLSQ
jgi:hypothetical protein